MKNDCSFALDTYCFYSVLKMILRDSRIAFEIKFCFYKVYNLNYLNQSKWEDKKMLIWFSFKKIKTYFKINETNKLSVL